MRRCIIFSKFFDSTEDEQKLMSSCILESLLSDDSNEQERFKIFIGSCIARKRYDVWHRAAAFVGDLNIAIFTGVKCRYDIRCVRDPVGSLIIALSPSLTNTFSKFLDRDSKTNLVIAKPSDFEMPRLNDWLALAKQEQSNRDRKAVITKDTCCLLFVARDRKELEELPEELRRDLQVYQTLNVEYSFGELLQLQDDCINSYSMAVKRRGNDFS